MAEYFFPTSSPILTHRFSKTGLLFFGILGILIFVFGVWLALSQSNQRYAALGVAAFGTFEFAMIVWFWKREPKRLTIYKEGIVIERNGNHNFFLWNTIQSISKKRQSNTRVKYDYFEINIQDAKPIYLNPLKEGYKVCDQMIEAIISHSGLKWNGCVATRPKQN